MTAKNRADAQSEIDSLLADNSTGNISPLDTRTVHETSKDSNLNLIDTAGTQTVLGDVDFTGTVTNGGEALAIAPNRLVVVNAKGDLPTPAAGVITLAANTAYLIADDISLGTDTLTFSDGVTLRGVDSINHTLTYTGSVDMMTFSDVTCRVERLTISCANGRVFNYSSTLANIFRVNDVSITSCDRVGLFDGTGSIVRFTNVSPAAMATSGLTFVGSWKSALFEVSVANVNGGSMFDLGAATFDAFYADTFLATIASGATFLSGAVSSANITAGGIGSLLNNRFSGAGAILSGVTSGDALWEYRGNDDIADTRPDGLISMQGNATATVIASSGVAVLVAGTWVVELVSQATGTTAGRVTYNGGKTARLPITSSVSVAPVSGTNLELSAYIAINGTIVANSKRTATASSGQPSSITIPWQADFQTGDYVEVFVANEDTTADIIVSSAVHRVN